MAVKHKHSSEGVTIVTSIGRQELAELARRTADQAHGNAWNSPGKVRFEQASADYLDFSVQGPAPLKRELMTFRMRVTPAPGGDVREVRVAISRFKTMQSKFMVFIPIGPKRLLGLAAYRSFLDGLASGVKAMDPTSRIAGLGMQKVGV
jgi:hypothetical protein